MLTKIIEFSVKNKLIVALLILALIGVGAYQVTKLPIDAVPDITNNQVQVITIAPSFGATDIERLVTFPIEQANSNIAGLQEIRSFSRFGLSLVTIVFGDNIDIYWARQQVAERLQQVQQEIPQGVGQPQLGPISTGLGEIYQYVVRPQQGYERKYNVTELRTIQDWIIRRQLLGVKGVAEVSSFGGKLKQYEIAVKPDRLNAYRITINDVFDALNANNQNTGGAYIEKGPTVLYIRSEGLVGTIADIQNIVIVGKQNDLPIFIRDIAEVRTGYATRYGAMTYNDNGEVAGAIVMMLKGANSSQVIADVKAKVEEIRKTLPKGVVIEPFLDRTKMVNNAINTVQKNLLEGALIVVFVLVLFLGNIRAGLLVASVIPLAMLFAICMMNLFGVSGNLMSLGALDFGLIIDGAVIIVESVMHQLLQQQRLKSLLKVPAEAMDNIVNASAGRMMNSAVFGQVIILVVYLPILTLEGIEGKMFKPMAETVAFALLGAFLLSLTYIPMMSAILLRTINSKPSLSDRLMKRLEKLYVHVLLKVLRFPKVIFVLVISFFILAMVILSHLGGEFIPSLEEGDFAVDTRVLPGSNLTTTIESTQKAAHILKSRFPEVEKVVTKIGSGEVPTDPMPMEASDMMVILKDKKEWTSAQTFPELAEKMGKALTDVPGITAGFQYPVQMRFNELMTGARQDVVLKIFGDNLDSLALYAQKIGKIIETIQGTQNLYIEPIAGLPQVVIQYNRSMIAQHHLSIAEVNRTINTAFAGQPTGLVFEGEKRFDMVVRMDASDRKNMTDIRNLLIPTPAGNQIPLAQLASVAIVQGPNQIQRENAQRRIVVGFNIKDRDVQSIVRDLQAKIDKEIKLPAGYSIKYGGSFENLNNARQRLLIAVPIALALIFILLFLAFRSVKESLLIYSAIPLSIIGGVFLLALRGMPFSISAGVGFIALFGVAVLNGIVLISEFNRLQKSGIHNIVRIVVDGGKNRLRPVLMTASVASLGFIPMALSNGAGAEVQRPLATVVIGGLLIATLLTLFVLPLLYVTIEKGFKGTKLKSGALAPMLFVIALLSVQNSNAQTVVTLDQSIALAQQNNRSLKSEKLRAAYTQALIGTFTADIPQTEIGFDYGQINGAYQDSKFSIVQRFAFPAVYRKQRTRYIEDWKKSQLNVALKEFELKKAVSLTYYNILYWQQKEQLLTEALSLYSSFLAKTVLRQKAGESDVLESATAANQKTAIVIQLRQVDAEIKVLQSQFQWLLNSDLIYTPASTGKVFFNPPSLEGHPLLKVLEQGKTVAEQATAVEKSKLLPQLQLGYNLNSFKGVGPNNKTYGASPRFHSLQLGLAIPVFAKGQKARVEASRLAEEIADDEYHNAEIALVKRKQELSQRFQSSLDVVGHYETSELKNADTIFETAQKQFSNGAINYLEFVTLVNQAISLKSNYADALWQLNESAIQLHYIMLNQ
ncbi:CusA/CzcA family heavy metal efflux RND transporter [Sphingobacterium sp. GVS05A]|uniref:CusA/CzcA family heavy metal efflux RND transporter n=1 Tax=Sphingobacterium sp. GVS05A TaxID=2862679 RepID=UPI001CBCE4AB|nr:CusA/CzcA family heavy metal efflux RND transporter [Sphingobacterium sp. GVS05A]